MSTKSYRYIALLTLLVFVTLACQALSRPISQINQAKETAQSVATQVQELATDATPLVETIAAVATENPEVVATIDAVATQGFSAGEAPQDIPVVDQSTVSAFFGSNDVVSYVTSMKYQDVLNFYKQKMPDNGWEALRDGTYEIENTAILQYAKPDRTATVTISVNPIDNTVIVGIAISAK